MSTDMQLNTKKAVAFLKTLFPGKLVNIVAIDPFTEVVTAITRPVDDTAIASFIDRHNSRANVYYSVNTPTDDAPDKKLKKEHIKEINGVFIDADPIKGKDFQEERKRLHELAKTLAKDSNPPTVITDSGGGIQAFWMLDKPVPVNDDTRMEYEALGRGLAQQYNTDKVQNIDRIMRLPYTLNIPGPKKKGREATLARSSKISTYRYPALSFITPLEADDADNEIDYSKLKIEDVKQPLQGDLLDKFEKLRKRNKKVDDLWTLSVDHKEGDRSARDFTLAKELKGEGFSLEEVAVVLWNYPQGKVQSVKYPVREIIRCYDRSGSDVEPVSQELIDFIAKQVNPLMAARAAGKPIEEDLNRTGRFRSVKLSKMDWKKSGKAIYRNFIYENAITVIYGRSNTGKSFAATEVAGHIALGRPWNGMEFEPAQVPGVLYICAEAGQSFGIRGQALMRRLGVDDLPFHVITEAPTFTKEDKSDAKAIVEEIGRIEEEYNVKIGLVVVDTLAVTFQGDENTSSKMGDYINNMKYIQHHADTGVLIVHHSGKDQAAGARGSSALQAATDTEIEVTSTKRGEKHERKIEVKKQRTGKSGMVVKFGLWVIELGKDDRGKLIDSCYVVLESDTEFGDVFDDGSGDLSENARATIAALKFYDAIPNPDTQRLTERQIKIIIHHDIIKGNGVFDMNRPDKAMPELFAMKKPSDTMDRAFLRGCDELAVNNLVDKNKKHRLVKEETDTTDMERT